MNIVLVYLTHQMPRAKKSDSVSTVSTEKVETIKKPKLKKTMPKKESIEETIQKSGCVKPKEKRVLVACSGKTKRAEACKRIVREGHTLCSLHVVKSV